MVRDPERGGTIEDGRDPVRSYACCSDCLLVSLALTILADPVIRLL